MIETRVRIVADDGPMKRVEATEHNGCGACASRDACGISGLGKLFGRRRSLSLACESGQRGDELIVGVEESALLSAGLAVYLFPTVLAIAAAAVATALGLGDAVAVPATGAGLALGLALSRLIQTTPRLVVRPADSSPHSGVTP